MDEGGKHTEGDMREWEMGDGGWGVGSWEEYGNMEGGAYDIRMGYMV